jgi:hypothetical protein
MNCRDYHHFRDLDQFWFCSVFDISDQPSVVLQIFLFRMGRYCQTSSEIPGLSVLCKYRLQISLYSWDFV